jgi:hypothetical protein
VCFAAYSAPSPNSSVCFCGKAWGEGFGYCAHQDFFRNEICKFMALAQAQSFGENGRMFI